MIQPGEARPRIPRRGIPRRGGSLPVGHVGRVLLHLLLGSLLLCSCSPAEIVEPQRWIPEDPEGTFSIERLAEGLTAAELRELASRPWKVGLDNVHRNALLAVSGEPVTRVVRIPSDGRLRLEYGVACTTPSAFRQLAPVRLEVLLERGGAPEILWEALLDSDDADRALKWNEAMVDLSGHGGREATVSIRTTTTVGPDRLRCVVAVANPEVTSEAAEQRGPNVIVISLDTLRADRLSLYGNQRRTTPEIDTWARSGTTFATTVAQAGWTLPSHVSLLTGLDPFHHGVNYNSPAPDSMTFVAEVFRRAGYRTAAVTGGGWMSPEYGFAQGFDRYASWPRGDNERELESNLERFLEWLGAQRDRRFFALFHTYEPHGPYRPRQPWFDRFYSGPVGDRAGDVDWAPPRPNTGVVDRRVEFVWRWRSKDAGPSDPEARKAAPPGSGAEPAASLDSEMLDLVSALYDSSVAYTDARIGDLFRRLRELGLEERTVVVVTSDHGEALGEHGLQGHGYTHDHNLLVPLIVRAPGLGEPVERVDTQVRSIDIVPTLLELAGLPPLEGIDGQSLVPLMRGEGSRVDREAWGYQPKGNWGVALRPASGLKYIYNDSPWAGLRARESLFLVERDPAERNDLARSPGMAREAELLRERVRERLSTAPGFRVRVSSAAGERLRGRLSGGLAQPQKIKTVDMPCDCLEWIPRSTVGFEVPPGTAYTLLFRDVPPDARLTVEGLTVEGRPEIRHPESVEIELDELPGPWTLSLVEGEWKLEEGDHPGGAPALTFWWNGAATFSTSDPSGMDPELAEQLRALGYIR